MIPLSYMPRAPAGDARVLSVRIQEEDWATLREVMRREGASNESEATRLLIRRARQRLAAEAIVRRLRRHHARGPKVDASEQHDSILPGSDH